MGDPKVPLVDQGRKDFSSIFFGYIRRQRGGIFLPLGSGRLPEKQGEKKRVREKRGRREKEGKKKEESLGTSISRYLVVFVWFLLVISRVV